MCLQCTYVKMYLLIKGLGAGAAIWKFLQNKWIECSRQMSVCHPLCNAGRLFHYLHEDTSQGGWAARIEENAKACYLDLFWNMISVRFCDGLKHCRWNSECVVMMVSVGLWLKRWNNISCWRCITLCSTTAVPNLFVPVSWYQPLLCTCNTVKKITFSESSFRFSSVIIESELPVVLKH